ncbi:hypothetical protein D3C75_959650 [compost metagenome]
MLNRRYNSDLNPALRRGYAPDLQLEQKQRMGPKSPKRRQHLFEMQHGHQQGLTKSVECLTIANQLYGQLVPINNAHLSLSVTQYVYLSTHSVW